ncbi:glycosyltransferase [Arcticibacter sp.]|uniref:glycosyltransferase n=1 Tax=Arcticibacter sp. TaxID=1872630 RepID=UPI003890F5DA
MVDYIFVSVFILLQVVLIIQLYFITIVHGRLRNYKITGPAAQTVLPVSVIICARNEEKNLEKNLSLILEQDYPDFEVVVVNDCSSDDSEMLLRGFSSRYPHLKVVTLTEHARFKHGKKFAVTIGVKAAKNEHLLFTDADCRPASPNWIRRMQAPYSPGISIVLGYSPYTYRGGFLNAFIRYESFSTALNYLSFALSGNPYMGVGRNLSYTKSLFFKAKGFASHMHILSGDDDLFVNENATAANTRIEIHPDSHVWSEPKTSWSSLWRQKVRHMGAGKAYKAKDKRILSLQTGTAVLFYILLGAMAALQAQWWIVPSVYLIRLIIQIIVYYPAMKKLNCKNVIWWFPLLDLFFNTFICILASVALFRKKVQWK